MRKYNLHNLITACSVAVLVSACGGTGPDENNGVDQPNIGAASEATQTTAELTAPEAFDWSTDTGVALSLVLHDAEGELASNVRVTVYEMPREAAAEDNREPTDEELLSASTLYTGYSDSNGRIDTTLLTSGHAITSGNVFVKTKLSGIASTAVVPIDDAKTVNPSANWVFGPADVATPQIDLFNPFDLGLGARRENSSMQRSAQDGIYYLQPFSSYYHSYYGAIPAAWSGGVCDVVNDPARKLCVSRLEKTEYQRISEIVQEGTPAPDKYVNASNELSNLIFNKPAKVTFSFLQEGAGYQNTFGFFTYNSDAAPTDPDALDSAHILFPNTSYRNSGGYMYSGDSISTGEIDPADGDNAIGFFIAANGWTNNQGQGYEGQHFYSINDLNPEDNKADAKHMLLIANEEINTANNTRRLWIAIEDIRLDSGTSDRDYNDLVIQVDVYPADALVYGDYIPDTTENENIVMDADNDGVLAVDDVDDNDPDRAFERYYPAEKSWATLLAEDNWPVLGDFDMNDMVVRYQVKEVVDSTSRVKEVSINYILEARGAAFHNGFAVAFGDKVFADNIESATINDETVNPLPDPTMLAYEIFGDSWSFTPRGDGENCWTYNTNSDCKNRDSSAFEFKLTFATPVDQGNLNKPPYNPFLFAHKTAFGTPGYTRFDSFNSDLYTEGNTVKDIEIHLPNKRPTQGQDASMFGTGDDTTDIVNRFYLSEKNLPWILNIPYQIRYPEEHVDIVKAYPGFATWMTSGGIEKRDWYLEPAEEALVYDATNNASDDVSVEENESDAVVPPTGENLSLINNATAYGSGRVRGTKYQYLNDNNMSTFWSAPTNSAKLLMYFGSYQKSNTVVIREAEGYEGRVGDWRVLSYDTGLELARGNGLANASVGVGVIEYEATKSAGIYFIIDSATDLPSIAEFETYFVE